MGPSKALRALSAPTILTLGENSLVNKVLVIIEWFCALATLSIGIKWYLDPDGNWEPLIAVFGIGIVAVDIIRRNRSNKSTLTNRFESEGARIQHRELLRKQIQEEIYKCRAEKLRQDVIVRDMSRVDNYPDTSEAEEGISSWFRVSLLDTYEKGAVLGLSIGGLKECEGGYRYVDSINGEKSDITALLMADVPYDSIEAVNMDGDEYYYFPHIYCYFDFDGEPYERKWFAEQIDQPHGRPYFRKIAEYDEVIRNNPVDGDLHFG